MNNENFIKQLMERYKKERVLFGEYDIELGRLFVFGNWRHPFYMWIRDKFNLRPTSVGNNCMIYDVARLRNEVEYHDRIDTYLKAHSHKVYND